MMRLAAYSLVKKLLRGTGKEPTCSEVFLERAGHEKTVNHDSCQGPRAFPMTLGFGFPAAGSAPTLGTKAHLT